MVGVTFSLAAEEAANGIATIRSQLNTLVKQGQDIQPLLQEIGEYLLLAHDERWQKQQSPDGEPWQPLSPDYATTKSRNPNLILVLNRHLSRELSYDTSQDELQFGTNYEYGAIHHFGGTPIMRPQNAAIPARPWLGASEEDLQVISEMVIARLKSA
ncbi:phage virion morphogenesis protein [Thaumasiovibrio subtropicus]|uniref:phage virion morphogenesis protein n=1 Tax=Thaumasiovibrio subtropicus TaxID=1891207 RepID=UPI000B3600E9|nr:phage virion morphogenesis protein [Thaumasiovibrio subtropicus]